MDDLLQSKPCGGFPISPVFSSDRKNRASCSWYSVVMSPIVDRASFEKVSSSSGMGAARGLIPRDQVRGGRLQQLSAHGTQALRHRRHCHRARRGPSEWGQIALHTLHQASGHTAYAPQADEKRALFLAAADSASDPDVVAREIIKAIQASRPKTRYVVGAFAKPSVFMSTFMPDRVNDWFFGAITKILLKQQRRKSSIQTA